MTSTTVNQTPADHSAHDAAMAAKGADVEIISGKESPGSNADFKVDTPPPAESNGRPENIPEKFWDADKGEVRQDALLEAYRKLESGRGESPDAAADSGTDSGDDSADSDDTVSDHIVTKAQAEFDKDGTLSDETYAALEADGVTRETVDAYISGMESQRELAFVSAGGEDNYNDMIEWAGKNLTPAEIEEFDSKVAESSPRDMAAAVKALSERYTAEHSTEPKLVDGDGQAVVTDRGYQSSFEMQADMASEQYRKDPAFRAEVMRKIAAAEKAGTDLYS